MDRVNPKQQFNNNLNQTLVIVFFVFMTVPGYTREKWVIVG
ncbi:hypothetical protein cce_0501 [Crocosphaera subtropica ATCC 51142]|uniref:Uncharacterized protein n=1 Tax=Crocosphaera subtropica (strain ATCC 51142 / BH68) TaxID=43989 RepID=B1WP70_CROS5|nr:hypothetical protein cce_0501 [Crocosphaera subtropica ATCC 51142]